MTKIVSTETDGDIRITRIEAESLQFTIREESFRGQIDFVLCFRNQRLEWCASLAAARKSADTWAKIFGKPFIIAALTEPNQTNRMRT